MCAYEVIYRWVFYIADTYLFLGLVWRLGNLHLLSLFCIYVKFYILEFLVDFYDFSSFICYSILELWDRRPISLLSIILLSWCSTCINICSQNDTIKTSQCNVEGSLFILTSLLSNDSAFRQYLMIFTSYVLIFICSWSYLSWFQLFEQ